MNEQILCRPKLSYSYLVARQGDEATSKHYPWPYQVVCGRFKLEAWGKGVLGDCCQTQISGC